MLSPNMAYILGFLWSWKRFRSFLIGTHDSFCRFLEYVKFLVYNRQSGFPELHSYRKHSKIQSILDYCRENNWEKNKQWFWNQNWTYSVILSQSISKRNEIQCVYELINFYVMMPKSKYYLLKRYGNIPNSYLLMPSLYIPNIFLSHNFECFISL